MVIAGYPGTIASLGQQAGRAGRRAESSAVVLVASAAPLDQYLAAHPRYVFESTPEHALINPDNLALLVDHLRCAAFELPFQAGEAFGGNAGVDEVLEVLAEEGELHASNGQYRWVSEQYPAQSAVAALLRRRQGRDPSGRRAVAGRWSSARWIAVPRRCASTTGAVYLHEGRSYMVENLDWESGLAEVQAEEVDYFTQASEAVELEIVNIADAQEAAGGGDSPTRPARPR